MSRYPNLIPMAFIIGTIIWLFSIIAFGSWADVECSKKGYDTSKVSAAYTYNCVSYPWRKP